MSQSDADRAPLAAAGAPTGGPAHAPAGGTADLVALLEGAESLPLEDRLALLRRTEHEIAAALDGLDGL